MVNAAWQKMYPGIERPKVSPGDLIKLCPKFKDDKVFYKTYCLYRKYKESQGQGAIVLSEDDFKDYFNQKDNTITDFEDASM